MRPINDLGGLPPLCPRIGHQEASIASRDGLGLHIALGARLYLIAGAVVAVLAAAAWIYFEGRSSGKNTVRIEQLENTNETQRNINDADAHGPRTPDVAHRLRDGKF